MTRATKLPRYLSSSNTLFQALFHKGIFFHIQVTNILLFTSGRYIFSRFLGTTSNEFYEQDDHKHRLQNQTTTHSNIYTVYQQNLLRLFFLKRSCLCVIPRIARTVIKHVKLLNVFFL